MKKTARPLVDAKQGSGIGRKPLAESIARLLRNQGGGPDSIGLGLILAGSVTPEDLQGMLPGMEKQGARIVAISTADPFVFEEAQVAVAQSKIQCFVMQDYGKLLELVPPKVVVVVDYLRSPSLYDETFARNVSGATAIERIVARSAIVSKDCYVSRSTKDQGRWSPDASRESHPTAPVQATELTRYENPMIAVMKFQRIASFGGLNWEDFETFLGCVKTRERPPHTLGWGRDSQ